MSNAVTIAVAGNPAVGTALTVSGNVTPAADTVQIQLAPQNTTLPTGPWFSTTNAGGAYAGTLTPVAPGTWYAWAYDPTTGAQAVSGAVVAPPAGAPYVPVPTTIVATLLGGSAAGETVDQIPPAAPASDTDVVLVGQGGKSLLAQTFTAIWAYIVSKLPSYLRPQLNVAAAGNVSLQTPTHNGRLLVVAATGVTIVPLIPSLGPGFECDVVNASSGTVALSGITTNTGAAVVAAGATARLLAYTAPGGTLTVYGKL